MDQVLGFRWRVIVGLLSTLVVMIMLAACCYYCCGGETRIRAATLRRYGTDEGQSAILNILDNTYYVLTITHFLQSVIIVFQKHNVCCIPVAEIGGPCSEIGTNFDPSSPYAFTPPEYDSLPKEPPKYGDIFTPNGQVNPAYIASPEEQAPAADVSGIINEQTENGENRLPENNQTDGDSQDPPPVYTISDFSGKNSMNKPESSVHHSRCTHSKQQENQNKVDGCVEKESSSSFGHDSTSQLSCACAEVEPDISCASHNNSNDNKNNSSSSSSSMAAQIVDMGTVDQSTDSKDK